MYRNSKEYDQIAQLAIDIYCDYQLTAFPIDAVELCKKMGVRLIPYSSFSEMDRLTLLARSDYGFYVPSFSGFPPRIFFNDDYRIVGSDNRIRFYLLHELKHYVNEDTDPYAENDDLADYFAKYMACPIPALIIAGISTAEEISQSYGVGYTVAEIVASNIKNRLQKYGIQLFDYEKPLIQLLYPNYKLSDNIERRDVL